MKKMCDIMLSRQEGSMMRYLANAHYSATPASVLYTRRLFLSHGGAGRNDWYSYCPNGQGIYLYKSNFLIKFAVHFQVSWQVIKD